MKTRKRLKYTTNTRKKTRKTQYAGMYCYLNDNIQELSPIYLAGNDNGVITKGEKGQVINLNCCWMNSALYAFLAHDQVYNILEQRDHTSFELQKNEDRDDHSLYELAIMVKEFRDLGNAPPYTAVRWDAWSYHELYKLIKEKYNFMPEDFPRFGDFGDARTIFELFLNLFERRSKSKQNIEKVKIGWEKLIGNHGYVNSLQELCDFLNQNEGYTCVSFTKTWRCITEVQTVSEDEEFDAFHFVTYARINKNKWRFFDSGNTVEDVSLEQTILPFCPKGKAYYISGLFVKNNSLQEDNKGKQEEDNKGKQEEDNKGKQEEDEELQRALALSLTENQNESEEMRLARLAAEENALQLGDEDDLATVKSDDDKDADWSSDNQSSRSSSSSSSFPTQDVVPQVNQTSEEDNGDNEFEEAEILYMTGKYEEALPLLREALIKYMLLEGNISHNPPVLDKDIQFIEENLKNVDTELKRRKEEIMKEQIAIDKENAEAEELRLVQEKEKAQADLDAKNKELELAKKKSDEERTISEEFENLRIQEEKEKERIQNEQAEAERKAIEKQQELEAKAEENKNMLLLAQQAEKKRIQDEQAEAERKAIEKQKELEAKAEAEQKRIQDEQAEAERKAIEKQKELEAKAEENKNMLLLAQQAEQKRIQDEEAETKRKAIEKQKELEAKAEAEKKRIQDEEAETKRKAIEKQKELEAKAEAEQKRMQDEEAETKRKAIEKQQELEAKAQENKNMLLLAQQAEQKRMQDEEAETKRKAIEKQQELEAKAQENKNMLLLAQQAEQKRIQDEEAETKRKAIEKQNEIKRRKQKIENAKNDYRSDMDVRLKNMLKYNKEELIPASKKIVKENARFYKIWEIYWEDKEKFGMEDSMNKVMKSLIKLIVEHPEEYEAIAYIKRYIKRREFELKETDENDPQHKILLGVIEYLRGVLQKSLKRKQELERGENKIGDEIEKTYNQLQDPKLQNNREQEATESLIKSIEKKNNSKLEESNQRKTQKKKLLRLQSQIEDIKPKQNILQKKIIDPVKQIKTLKLVLNKPTTEKSTENEPSERWIKRNGQWVRGIETSEEKYLREKQEERKQKEKEIQRIELQKGHEIEMKEQLEHERLYKEREAKKAAEKEENKREVIRNRKLKHPAFINLASNELEEGEEIIYHRSDGKTVMAVIKKIHKDDRVPYYTIQFQDGTERQTVRDKIEKIM